MNSNNHTFVIPIPTHKESLYLEECILSLKQQTVKSKVLITTPAPSDFIKGMATKYGVELLVNDTSSGVASDWNFALSSVKTQYCTIAHQDATYHPEYSERMLNAARKNEDSQIVFCDYLDFIKETTAVWSPLLLIKRIILLPFYIKNNWRARFVKRSALTLGCSICNSSVLYNLKNLKDFKFCPQYEVCHEWQAWLKIACEPGSFVLVPRQLVTNRIPSATPKLQQRSQEDFRIFQQLWGNLPAKFLMLFYSHSYNIRSHYNAKQTASYLSKEVFRYILGGLTTMLVCFLAAYFLIKKFEVNYLIANNVATLLAWSYSYIINKYFVFKNTEQKHVIQGSSFIITQIIFLIMANIIIFILIDLLKIPFPVAFIILAAIMAAINFTTMKLLIFRKGHRKTTEEQKVNTMRKSDNMKLQDS